MRNSSIIKSHLVTISKFPQKTVIVEGGVFLAILTGNTQKYSHINYSKISQKVLNI